MQSVSNNATDLLAQTLVAGSSPAEAVLCKAYASATGPRYDEVIDQCIDAVVGIPVRVLDAEYVYNAPRKD